MGPSVVEKYFAMKFLLIFGLLAAVSSVQGAKPDPKVLANAVQNGGVTLTKTINKFKDTFVRPLMAEIKFHAGRINTNLDGLEQEEKQLVTTSLQSLERTEVEVAGVRIILVELAKSTIKQSQTLRRIMDKVDVDDSMERAKKKLGYTAKYMIKLMKTSEGVLQEAKEKYDLALRDLATCKGSLQSFVNKVKNLGSDENERFQAWASKTRGIVYGTTWAAGPAGLAIAATVLETEIAKYKENVRKLNIEAAAAEKSARSVLNDADKKIKEIQTEVRLITRWRNSLDELKVAFEDEESFVDHITWLEEKDDTADRMKDLEKACQNYINFVEKN